MVFVCLLISSSSLAVTAGFPCWLGAGSLWLSADVLLLSYCCLVPTGRWTQRLSAGRIESLAPHSQAGREAIAP